MKPPAQQPGLRALQAAVTREPPEAGLEARAPRPPAGGQPSVKSPGTPESAISGGSGGGTGGSVKSSTSGVRFRRRSQEWEPCLLCALYLVALSGLLLVVARYFLQGRPESPPLLVASSERSSSWGPSTPDDITWWTAFTRSKKVASTTDVEVTEESKVSSPSELPAVSASAKKEKRSRSTAHRVTMTKKVALPSMSDPLEPTLGTPVPPLGTEEPDLHDVVMVRRHIPRR